MFRMGVDWYPGGACRLGGQLLELMPVGVGLNIHPWMHTRVQARCCRTALPTGTVPEHSLPRPWTGTCTRSWLKPLSRIFCIFLSSSPPNPPGTPSTLARVCALPRSWDAASALLTASTLARARPAYVLHVHAIVFAS